MTRYDAGHRLLDDIEKHNERALAKHEMQVNLLCAYRDQLEEHVDIAARMIMSFADIGLDDAMKLIVDQYERRQAARKAATA